MIGLGSQPSSRLHPLPASVDPVAVLREQGYVILPDALPVEYIDALRASYLAALDAKLARFGIPRTAEDGVDHREVGLRFRPRGGNHDINRWNMHLPSRQPFLDDRVLALPAVLAVLDPEIGDDGLLLMVASDTPLAGSAFQPFHQDFHRLAFTVNIPLIDVEDDCAPLEVIPGSHRPLRDDGSPTGYVPGTVHHSRKHLAALIARQAPVRCLLRRGDVLIRDQRLVHRGTAGSRMRPMLSLWYKPHRGWSPASLTLPVPNAWIHDVVAAIAGGLRRLARGGGGAVADPTLLNLGNLLGRLVEELGGSDRAGHRRISAGDWAALGPRSRRLLRYARRDAHGPGRPADDSAAPRSLIGSVILLALASIIVVLCLPVLLVHPIRRWRRRA